MCPVSHGAVFCSFSWSILTIYVMFKYYASIKAQKGTVLLLSILIIGMLPMHWTSGATNHLSQTIPNADLTLCWSWSPMDTWICPFGSSFRNFLASPKISRRLLKLMPIQEKHNRSSYDSLWYPHGGRNVFTMFLWCFDDKFQPSAQCETCTKKPT